MSQQILFSTKNSSEINNNERRYCICQKSEDELNEQDNHDDFMIECDGCNGWFHGRCVALPDRIADDIEKYFCMECSKQHGPSIFKQQQNQHRRDYSDANAEQKPIQSGTKIFINKLKQKTFSDCESVILRIKGDQLTNEYLFKNGFTKPILISNRDGLELTLPDRMITLEEINKLIDQDQYIDAIDCEKQVIYKMSFTDYIEYFESYDRNKIYNVLSLEVSNTKLGEFIIVPKIVRDLSWTTTGIWPNKKKDEKFENNIETNEINQLKNKRTWPSQSSLSRTKRRTVSSTTDTDQSDEDEDLNSHHFENFERPEVGKYCLISPQSSYTDFHIDFGGSSVWYSIVRGEKIFYLIEPTDENLQKYADWSKSPNESETFLGDCVSHCYKMYVREGNTIFLPAGWIHAVYTVIDSLVFGGNFLQSMDIDMQFRIYELERLAKVPLKFQYPLFETFHWYAAKIFYEQLRECNDLNSSTINPITQQACESIIYHMNRWLTNDKRYQIRNRYIIPKGINCEKLLRDLTRELDKAKTRCGSLCYSKLPSKTTITSSNKIEYTILDNKREFVQIGENKIKVKCRRLSSSSDSSKNKEALVGHEVKLTIKSTINEDRKKNNNENLLQTIQKKKIGRILSSIKQKKKHSKHRNLSRISYKLDLQTERQHFIQDAHVQSLMDDNESTNDKNIFSICGKSPTDNIESRDHNERLFNITDDGLTSFVKRSVIDKDIEIKQKKQCLKQKISSLKKSNFKSSDIDQKLTKKIKIELKKSTKDTSKKLPPIILKSSLSKKKRLLSSSSLPKKIHSKDRLGKILKIANDIKSKGGMLT
ncbi:unnamed protein product [Rotaria sordida]|uniref:[histone H3]-dimethyl-L-lysine(36) demethylase n=1 Tax=Rotaria sordida TaxID=392033 RepID=A0A818MQR7_9BILA|nr:unnamed protein product [Rotaria sordida]CAF3593075.1 unnamed protein product [Rotaria sordida]